MRTVLVYLLALAAVAAAALLGFPELLGPAPAAGAADRPAAEGAGAPPVVVSVAKVEPFQDSLEALGTVLANESVEITANRADHIAAVHFEDGAEVAAGELLVELRADAERARLAEAIAIREERRLRHQQVQELFSHNSASRRDLDTAAAELAAAEALAAAMQAAVDDSEIRAPFAGVLGLRRVSEGAYVVPPALITTLDDLTTVKLDFTIPETWLPAVQSGMAVLARSDAWPGVEFRGEVRMVDTRLDARTRAATVRAVLPNPDLHLRPGMLLKVAVARGSEPVLQVPEEALVPVGDRQHVWRVGEGDVAERVEVRVGRRRVGRVEVTEGLAAGDRVIVEGVLRARPGAAVRVVETR